MKRTVHGMHGTGGIIIRHTKDIPWLLPITGAALLLAIGFILWMVTR